MTLSVTNPKGTTSLTKIGNIVISEVNSACLLSSQNKNGNFGFGVTNVTFNTLNNITATFIPENATNDYSCSKNTTVFAGKAYNLNVNYKSIANGTEYLEVWIDWDNSGTFQTSNSKGVNEMVLSDNIPVSSSGSPIVSVIPPSNAVMNTLLRMRVVSEYTKTPTVCGNGFAQRADDYGVVVINNALSTLDLLNSKLVIFPNPVKDYLTISLKNNDEIISCQIYDFTGKKIMSSSKMINNTIHVPELTKGIYIIKLKTITGEMIGKFLKE